MAYYIIMDFVRQYEDIIIFKFLTESLKTLIIALYHGEYLIAKAECYGIGHCNKIFDNLDLL